MDAPGPAEQPWDYTARELFDEAPCGYLTLDEQGLVRRVNDTLLGWLDLSRDDVLDRPLAGLLSPAGRLTWENQVAPVLHLSGWARAVEVELRGPAGRRRMLLSARSLLDGAGRAAGIRVVAFDATERSQYEHELLRARREAEQSEVRLRALHRVVADLAAAPSPQAVADYLVDALSAVFGGTVTVWRADGDGAPVRAAGTHAPSELLPGVATPESLPGRAVAGGEVVLLDAARPLAAEDVAAMRAARLHVVVVVPLLSGEEVLGAYAVGFGRLRGMSADELEMHRTLGRQAGQALRRAELHDELSHLALHDALTGLPNRTLFADRVEQALARSLRTGDPVTVMALDLDGFKAVNDGHGHPTGDAVLVEAARRFTAALRPSDTVARMGGDEFTVLAEGIDESLARTLAGRLEESMRPPVLTDDGVVAVGTSVGVVVHTPARSQWGLTTATALLQAADTALHEAKRRGKGRHAVYDASLRAEGDSRLAALGLLETALADDGVVVHYQPVVDLCAGTVVGVEALCRLRAGDGSLVPPGQFMAVAEETGLIIPLGHRVLETACRQLADWHAAGLRLRVAVNVAAAQASHPAFLDVVRTTVATTGCRADHLSLELTESALLSASPESTAALEEVRALGVGLALDDFGTHYASLHYLQEFPLDTLKIDRSFVRDLPASPVQGAIVRSVVALARDLGLRCIAEGVETDGQRDFLAGLGVLGQGFLLGHPSPAGAVPRLVRGHLPRT